MRADHGPAGKAPLRRFLEDEAGGYTIWSLVWFMLYAAIGGLAVDVTNAYRTQAELQATADAAALAAAMALPNTAEAVTEAAIYSAENMDPQKNGDVLAVSDVTVGVWDHDTRTFTPGGASPNAVHVATRRADPNGNPVSMAMLRILALFGLNPQWNISAEAIAERYVPKCANDGFIARNQVDLSGNNDIDNYVCIHGQRLGVDLQNHNVFHPTVQVSMPDLDMLPDRANLFDMNPGLAEALVEGDLLPRDVDFIDSYIEQLRNLDTGPYDPTHPFMYEQMGNGTFKKPTKVTGTSLPPVLEPYTVYDINCNGQIQIPGQVVEHVVIVSSCRVHTAAGANLRDAVVASTYTGPSAAVHMAAQSVLGASDNCAPGGGVEIYTPGDVKIAAQGAWNGLRIVAGHDVEFTANNVDVHGISVQAGNDIKFTSNNQFALCSGNNPGPYAWHYRLVK